jgi:coxsackievirus/adenovirus receptor
MEGVPFFHGDQLDDYRKQQYDHYRCGASAMSASKHEEREECKRMLYSVGYYVFDGAFECGCNPTGSKSAICDTLGGQCQCKLNVVGRTCDRCAPGTYGFGPEGCRRKETRVKSHFSQVLNSICEYSSILLILACECNPIGSLDNFCDAQSGQCRCRPNTYGLQCNQCQPGYWSFPNCKQCNCHGHANTCNSTTGSCIECRDNTTGSTCDR